MNNDKLFRQALQRQNDRAAGMKMPDDMEQRVMKSIKPQATKRRWLYPLSAIAVAASVLLLIIFNIEKPQPEQQTPVIAEKVMPPVPVISDEPIEHAKPTKPIIPVKVAKTAAPKKQLAEAELPDTLGQGIFESEENVRLAVQMLSECEATIRREEQQVNNRIIKATFNALPQAENALLVTNENGDFEVIEVSEQTAIEI